MDTEIRLLRQEDRPLVQAFYDQMGSESRFFFNATGYNYRRTMQFFGGEPDPDILHWGAFAEGRMVGYVFLWNLRYRVVEVGIAVADDFKGRHLGGRLLDTVKTWCAEHGKGGILLTTHPANIRGQMLYRRSGFQYLGTSDNKGEFLFLLNLPEVQTDEK